MSVFLEAQNYFFVKVCVANFFFSVVLSRRPRGCHWHEHEQTIKSYLYVIVLRMFNSLKWFYFWLGELCEQLWNVKAWWGSRRKGRYDQHYVGVGFFYWNSRQPAGNWILLKWRDSWRYHECVKYFRFFLYKYLK